MLLMWPYAVHCGCCAMCRQWVIGVESRLCPESVHIKSLSNICPIPIFFIHKLKMGTQNTFIQVQRMSRNSPIRKNAIVSTLLDRGWTSSRFARPTSVQKLRSWTQIWHSFDQTWTAIRRALYMTSFRTDLGQALDMLWTEVGFCVQSPSNQPKSTSTHNVSLLVWEMTYVDTRDRGCAEMYRQ